MRLLAAASICAALLGGMAVYMQTLARRSPVTPYDEPATAAATVAYSLEITPAFRVGAKDPFALDLADEDRDVSLSVSLSGTPVFQTALTLEPGVPIRIESVDGLKVGENRLLVKATVSAQQSTHANAVRVVVYRGEVRHVDKTIWTRAGQSLSDEIVVNVADNEKPETPHDHD